MKYFLYGMTAALLGATPAMAQQENRSLASLYEQASETSGLVVQYENDVRAIQYFYGPMSSGGYGRWAPPAANSPEQRNRLLAPCRHYLDKLDRLDFGAVSHHRRVAYILLKRKLETALHRPEEEAPRYGGR